MKMTVFLDGVICSLVPTYRAIIQLKKCESLIKQDVCDVRVVAAIVVFFSQNTSYAICMLCGSVNKVCMGVVFTTAVVRIRLS